MGQVCAKHQQFYETECRWCEPPVGLYAAVPSESIFGIDNPPSVLAPPTPRSPSTADMIAGAIEARIVVTSAEREARMRVAQRTWTGHDPDACRICRLSLKDGMPRTGHLPAPDINAGHGAVE